MHKIALYFILIHMENALKAHQHISYCSIQKHYFKKKNFNTKSDQNIHQTHQIARFFINRRTNDNQQFHYIVLSRGSFNCFKLLFF